MMIRQLLLGGVVFAMGISEPFTAFAQTPASAAAASTPAAGPTPKQYTIEQFMDTTRVGGSSFSFDEKSILFHSNKSGIYNVYSIPTTGGAAKQLTNSTKESTYLVSAFPKDDRFLFTYDKGGNENSHLYIKEKDGKERDLTPGDKIKANFLKWNDDRTAFFISTNERNPKFFDIYKVSLPDFKRRTVYEDDKGFEFGDISNNGRVVAFKKTGNSTADSDVYVYNTETHEMKNITEHTGVIGNEPAVFDPKSKNLYFMSNQDGEFMSLYRYNLGNATREQVEKSDWDVTSCYFSKNGKYRVVTTNEDARTKLKIYNEAAGEVVAMPDLAQGDITGVRISDSETKLAFYLEAPRSPPDLYVTDLGAHNTVRLTNSLNPAINPNDLAEPRVIRYKSFDGLEIPAVLYAPNGASADHPLPAIVRVHGGPGGQARLPYYASTQYFVNHGYVILDVNNRGSSGYGRTFFTADDQKHGREPLWDCVEAKKYLASLGYVDPAKIGIMGGSYGGYMVLAALTFKPDDFAVGVDMFGISNWVRTLESIPPYWESQRLALYTEIGDPNRQKDMLREISPLFHAEQIKKPLMVLQGANDPRVIKPESDEIVAAVKQKGGVAEYVVFDDEGHGFSKKANEIKAYKSILDFLDKYLKG